jgi:hypothetical protein
MIIRRADEETEAGALPTPELVDAMMRYNEEMMNAGVMTGGDGLQPTSKGALVRFQDGRPTVMDGPFAEAKELIAGYTLIQVNSREEALEWVKRWPVEDAHGHVTLELRQLYEADDFGEEFTPALLAQEGRFREREAQHAR